MSIVVRELRIASLYISLSPNNHPKISLKSTKNHKTQKSPLFTKDIIPKNLLKITKNHNSLKKTHPKNTKSHLNLQSKK